jgi:hypothetical protein
MVKADDRKFIFQTGHQYIAKMHLKDVPNV